MITDNIKNISKYNAPSPLRGEGRGEGLIPAVIIDFMQNLTPDTKTGRYEISDGVYANVDEYEPKIYENCKFEAHKKYIDIQMVLSGEENLEYTNTDGLKISEEYDENRDVMFFENSKTDTDYVHLTPFKFAFIYPHEAHKPQIKTISDKVKKVVVKINVADFYCFK